MPQWEAPSHSSFFLFLLGARASTAVWLRVPVDCDAMLGGGGGVGGGRKSGRELIIECHSANQLAEWSEEK